MRRRTETIPRLMAINIDDRIQRLEEALRLRDALLNIVSHEIRTPLTVMELSLSSIKESQPDLTPLVAERIDLMHKQVDKLTHVVEALLSLSRASVRTGLSATPIDVRTVAREVIGRTSEDAKAAGCAVRLVGPDPVVGSWDKMLIDQILGNLVSNAIKYGIGKPVTIKVDQTETLATLSVRDHGPGIAQDEVARLFEPFARGQRARASGLGLGLWIVKQLVASLRGEVKVVSEVGAGSTFIVELPPA